MLCICRRAVSGVRLSSVTFVYCAETAIDTTVVAVEAFKWYHLQRHWVTPKLHFKVSTTDTGAQPLCDSWASCYCSERKQCTESDGRFVKYDAEILSPISYLQKLLGLRLICVYYPPPSVSQGTTRGWVLFCTASRCESVCLSDYGHVFRSCRPLANRFVLLHLYSVLYSSARVLPSPRSRGSARPKTASSLILRGHV